MNMRQIQVGARPRRHLAHMFRVLDSRGDQNRSELSRESRGRSFRSGILGHATVLTALVSLVSIGVSAAPAHAVYGSMCDYAVGEV